MNFGILSIILAFSFSASATIYGDDSFIDVLLTKDAKIINASRAVAVHVSRAGFHSGHAQWRNLGDSMICPNERFVKQPLIGGFCTAFLVAPDILLTASHCLSNITCAQSQWVFDVTVNSEDQDDISVDADKVYGCKELIKSSYSNKLDYALVRLDRAVEDDRKPLTLNPNLKITVGQELLTISSPRGLPLKASKGQVRSVDQKNYFTSNLDEMSGSSGAPVFDSASMEVVGIVAAGDSDYTTLFDPVFCNAFSHNENDGGRGEDATRISEVPFVNF
jgi:hypothetical protein